MKRIKFIKDCNGYRTGDVVNIDAELALQYITDGFAIISKDMTAKDYKTAHKASVRSK